MPLFFIFVALFLIAAGVNGKSKDLVALVEGDFVPSQTNGGGFGAWALAIFVIGAVGYIKPLKPIANAFLVLVILVLILAAGNPDKQGGGFFASLNNAIRGQS